MKWIKKVAETPLTTIAKVIDSLTPIPNDRVNAPSIHAVNEAITSRFSYIYPVGSIYLTVADVNPAALFGGTWERIREKFLLAAGDDHAPGTTGGEESNTLSVSQLPSHTHTYTEVESVQGHTLSVEEIPSHKHFAESTKSKMFWFSDDMTASDAQPKQSGEFGVAVPNFTQAIKFTANEGGGGAHSHELTTNSNSNTGSTGSGASIDNMPPYLSVYVWKRTA